MKKILISIEEDTENQLKTLSKAWGISKSQFIRIAIKKFIRKLKNQQRIYDPLEHMTKEQYDELIEIANTKWTDED